MKPQLLHRYSVDRARFDFVTLVGVRLLKLAQIRDQLAEQQYRKLRRAER